MWASLIVMLLVGAAVFGALYAVYMYQQRKRNKTGTTLEDLMGGGNDEDGFQWDPNEQSKLDMEKVLEENPDFETDEKQKSTVRNALVRRAMLMVPVLRHLHQSNGVRRDFKAGLASQRKVDQYFAAIERINAEVEEVQALANKVKEGWGSKIFSAVAQLTMLAERKEAEARQAQKMREDQDRKVKEAQQAKQREIQQREAEERRKAKQAEVRFRQLCNEEAQRTRKSGSSKGQQGTSPRPRYCRSPNDAPFQSSIYGGEFTQRANKNKAKSK